MAEVMLPPNSQKYRDKQETKDTVSNKNLKPVVTGTVRTRKKSFLTKMAESFFAEDIPDLKSYLIDEILIPSLRDTVDDLICNGTHMFLYGKSASRVPRHGRYRGSNGIVSIPYDSISTRLQNASVTPQKPVGRVFEPVVFDYLDDAEEVRNKLLEILIQYPVVTVGDLYQLIGRQTTQSSFEYGWKDLSALEITQFRDGHEWRYLLDLPDPKPINN